MIENGSSSETEKNGNVSKAIGNLKDCYSDDYETCFLPLVLRVFWVLGPVMASVWSWPCMASVRSWPRSGHGLGPKTLPPILSHYNFHNRHNLHNNQLPML